MKIYTNKQLEMFWCMSATNGWEEKHYVCCWGLL